MTTDSAYQFPVEAYLERIGLPHLLLRKDDDDAYVFSPSLQQLTQLIAHHSSSIPFESVDVVLRRFVSLKVETIANKMIRARRGGLCLEHNILFEAALRALGYNTIRVMAGRVLWRREPNSKRMAHNGIDDDVVWCTRPGRTHTCLMVELPDETNKNNHRPPHRYLVDVGFGSGLPQGPLRMDVGDVEQRTPAGIFRLLRVQRQRHEVDGWEEIELQMKRPARLDGTASPEPWRTLYAFDVQPQIYSDLHTISAVVCGESFFSYSLICSRVFGESDGCGPGRITVLDNVLTRFYTGAKTSTRRRTRSECCADASRLYDALEQDMGIQLSAVDGDDEVLAAHRVGREEFCAAAMARLKVFGGRGYTPRL